MTDVESSAQSVGLRFTLLCGKICFVAIYVLFARKKIVARNVPCGDKMTNMMYGENQMITRLHKCKNYVNMK